ncbi:MAG: GHKL domain-containing protein [Bacteroidetes bacterium]|nr:MAG: GHKL domain-containing protein [Bacteroidota bacterium]
MVSRRYFYNLTIRLVLISLTCFLLCLSFFIYPNYSVIIILFALFLYQVVMLVRYLNRINKKLENFFLFYLSGDVTSSNVKRTQQDEFSPLYMYFDLLNDKLEQARLKNEIQNNYFKTIVDETAVGLISFKADGSVDLFNEAAKKMLGIQVLRNLRKLNNIKEGFSEMLINMESNDRKLISLILEGELIQLATKKVKFKAMDEELHLVSFQNIKPELEEREIESWQRLIRVLTHEIMNSMTPIVTLVGTIVKKLRRKETNTLIETKEVTPEIVEKTVKGLDLIDSRGKGLITFVQNYRSITRLPKPDFQIVNVKDLFTRVMQLFENQLDGSGIELRISCHPSVFINADGSLLEQVLINLVKNATEALDEIDIPFVELSAHSAQEQVVIQVSDNGRGIPPELMEDIFVLFFTTKQSGSGIGLSLSRQIIRLHGGSMTVQSSPGSTIFTIRI